MPEFISRADVSSDVSFASPASALPFARSTAPTGVIGSLDGPAPTIFSRFVAAGFVDDTTIAAIDRESREVRLFSVRGRHIQTFGRDGSGPGEFRDPVAFVATPRGEILVADLRRIVQTFARGPRGFEYKRSITVPFGIRSMCYLGDRLFVNGATSDDENIIRAIDDSGRVTAAFGQIYRSPNRLVNYQISLGKIACDPARNLIYFMAGTLLGDVRAFRPTGELVWRVRVTDFLTNQVIDQGGGLAVQRSPKGAHSAGALTLTSRGVVAQFLFNSIDEMKAREAPTRVHSFLIDPSTGKATSLGTQLPLIVGRRGDLLLEQVEDLVPQLTVRRYTVGR